MQFDADLSTMADNQVVLGDVNFDYPDHWCKFYEDHPPSVLWAEKLAACNRGVIVTGAVECALAEGIGKSIKPETTNLRVQYDYSTKPKWKSQIDWGPELMSQCIDFDMDSAPVMNSAPLAAVDAGESTVVPALDKVSKALDKSPIGQAVKAAADLAALCKYAGMEWSKPLRYIESRWGLESGTLDDIISPSPVSISVGRLTASTGSRTSMTYGMDNFFGRAWIVPTGLTADNFLPEKDRKEGYIAAVDFSRMAEYAKFVVNMNAAVAGPSGDYFRSEPGIFDMTITAAFPTKHKITDYGLTVRDYPSGEAYAGEVAAIKEAAGYLTDVSYIKSVLSVYGLLCDNDGEETMYSVNDLRRLRRMFEQKDSGVIKSNVGDVKVTPHADVIWGERSNAALSRKAGTWTIFTENFKEQKALNTAHKVGYIALFDAVKLSVDLKPDGKVVTPVKEIRNRLKIAKIYNDYIAKGSYAILDRIAKINGSSGAECIESSGYADEPNRSVGTLASWMLNLPNAAYVAMNDMYKKVFNMNFEAIAATEAPVPQEVRPLVRAAQIIKSWHTWYTGRVVALKKMEQKDKKSYAKLIKYQSFAHILEKAQITADGVYVTYPPITDIVLEKIKKYARRKKVALPFDEVADFFEEALAKSDRALQPDYSFTNLYDELVALANLTTADIEKYDEEKVSPNKFRLKYSRPIERKVAPIPAEETFTGVGLVAPEFDLSFMDEFNKALEDVKNYVPTEEEEVYSLAIGLNVPRDEVNKFLSAVTKGAAHDYQSAKEAGYTLTLDTVRSWYAGNYGSIVDVWHTDGYVPSKSEPTEEDDVLN